MTAVAAYLTVLALIVAVGSAETLVQPVQQMSTPGTPAVVPLGSEPWYRTPYLLCGVFCFLILLQNEIKRLYNAKAAHHKYDGDRVKAGRSSGVLQESQRVLETIETPYKVWTASMVLVTSIYCTLGGAITHLRLFQAISIAGSCAESFGLLVLFQRIRRQRSVAGLSKTTIQLYAIAYTYRMHHMWPSVNKAFHDGYGFDDYMYEWAIWGLCAVSYVQVLDIMRRFFLLYPSTYESELDKIKLGPFLTSCAVLSMLIHPIVVGRWWYSRVWAWHVYVDCAALLPQVVMMSLSDGKVKAPIAHFVAATAFSRIVDTFCWIDNIRKATLGFSVMPNRNAYIILLAHGLSLLLICDFVWYYMKARLAGDALSADLPILLEDVI